MKFLAVLIAFTFFALGPTSVASGEDRAGRIADAIEVLLRVPTGKDLLEQASRFWGVSAPSAIRGQIRLGGASKTDAVLTRTFNSRTGEELRERRISIILKSDLALEDLVLDLAHELVHATARPSWDPYDPSLSAARYIEAAIDGAGGEVEAVYLECQISRELFQSFGMSFERCKRYWDAGQKRMAREKIRADFYRVGRWGRELQESLGSDLSRLSMLSMESPLLYSSTGQAPYPVALLREYQELTRVACENSRKRLASVTHHSSSQRRPAALLRTRCAPQSQE